MDPGHLSCQRTQGGCLVSSLTILSEETAATIVQAGCFSNGFQSPSLRAAADMAYERSSCSILFPTSSIT
jgi:hypothetical protein